MADDLSYNDSGKADFHRKGKAALRSLADALGLSPGTYDIRSNKGGVAVSGEVTLHGEHLYVQVSQMFTGGTNAILYRTCKGRSDYTGGGNRFADAAALDNPAEFAHEIQRNLRLGPSGIAR